MLGIWAVSLFLIATVKGAEVCYDRLGCFSDSKPWAGTVERPIGQLPWSPEKINPRFLLYTQQNQNSFQEISAKNASTISSSNFRTSRKTRFIVHGFGGRVEDWLSDMCKRMFQVEDVNCICVDWLGGSSTLYSQAANNIRVVGAEIAYFTNILSNNFDHSPSNVHIIGHSLGAHAAGEAGERQPGVGRITALDPARPYFQGTPTDVRLDPSDAVLVDVIHTDSGPMIPNLGLGTSQLVGHLDFFPNGGVHMPGCNKNVISTIVDIDGIWRGTRDFVACNHLRSHQYYLESIVSKDGFLGFPSSSYDAFQTGSGFPCPSGGCPRMGHYADTFGGVTPSSQTFYLNTGDAKDFSRYRHKVSVTVTGSSSVQGYFNLALYGSKGNTRQYQIFKGTMNAGSTYTAFIDVEVDVGTLSHVKFLWNNNILNPLLPEVGGQTAIVQHGRDGKTSKFCGSETVRDNILQTMSSC
ncbi:pancreatic triacylglycerol lipase-like isoform X2 [Ambystoma mexicanum]|uniref:pancreatic triacylglycerol lipase-like isoform X2 n=1 Tax=Ambystoma mexicanum TaxID=8296 RepID=UPI0037E95C3F